MKVRTVAWMFGASAAGRLVIYLLLRQHWGWQPPYHLTYLQPPQWLDPATHEFMVGHMPLYWAFLLAVRSTGVNLYVAAPLLQTVVQLAAIAWLTAQIVDGLTPRRLASGSVLAFALGLDPWLCDTAVVMQPASLSASLFVLLVERAVAWSIRVMSQQQLPRLAPPVLTSAALGAIGTYLRADFATYAALVALAIALSAYMRSAATFRTAVVFAFAASCASVALVAALLLPRAVYLRRAAGALVMTTNTGGAALWYGLGEIPNPWNIPNPESGDDPIDQFARAHGYRSAFASARSSAFFRQLFVQHVRERPWFLARLLVYRGHRVLLGWPPTSILFRGDYEAWPQMGGLGDRLASGTRWYRVLADREYGPWFLKIFGLRWLGSALLWLTVAAAVVGLGRRRPLLVLPALAYAIGIGVFVLVHWSFRYGQQFYWLGYVSVYLLSVPSEPARRR